MGVVQKERLTAANRALSQALQHLFTLGFNAQDLVRAIAPCMMKDVKRLTWTAWVQAEWQLFESRGGSQDLANQMLSQVIDAASYEAEKEHRLAGEDQAIQQATEHVSTEGPEIHEDIHMAPYHLHTCSELRTLTDHATAGLEPRDFRLRSGCDTTTSCAKSCSLSARYIWRQQAFP